MRARCILHAALLTILVLLTAACARHAPSAPEIRLVIPPDNPSGAFVELKRLSPSDIGALRRAGFDRDKWTRVLRVTVKPDRPDAAGDRPAVAGHYAVKGDVVRFTPLFPFDPGRQYEVVFDPSQAPGQSRGTRVVAAVSRPADAAAPATTVTHVYPGGTSVPENQLRLYIHFSAPMGLRGGFEHIALLDDKGQELKDAFLPLDAELWNHDRMRYTVLFDPGRVKRGILPNRAMGRALRAGRSYTLVVRREWLDGRGQPLAETFSRPFTATRAVTRPLDPATWRIETPAEGTTRPLIVQFPEPLDRGLLERAVGIRQNGAPFPGDVQIDANETRWTFTPHAPWTPGDYALLVLSILEDLAGNRLGRAFEVDNDEPAASAVPESISLPLTLHPR